jgi:hypothetical protein
MSLPMNSTSLSLAGGGVIPITGFKILGIVPTVILLEAIRNLFEDREGRPHLLLMLKLLLEHYELVKLRLLNTIAPCDTKKLVESLIHGSNSKKT